MNCGDYFIRIKDIKVLELFHFLGNVFEIEQ